MSSKCIGKRVGYPIRKRKVREDVEVTQRSNIDNVGLLAPNSGTEQLLLFKLGTCLN